MKSNLECSLAKVTTQQSTRFSLLTSTDLLASWWMATQVQACFFYLLTSNSPYLTDLLHHHKSTRFTCSSSSHLLDVLHHNLSFGSRAFRVFTSQIYNSVPLPYSPSSTFAAYKHHLKAYYFQSTFLAP